MQKRNSKILDQIRSLPRDEAGSITIFSLIIFVLILMCAGMAVDMMRYERERTGLQNAMDSGVIAASSLNQGADPTLLVKDYVEKAGFNPDLVTVNPDISEAGGNVIGRNVSAVADFQMNTMFMKMMGIEALPGRAAGTALEGSQILEIVLVLDISGSMGWAASGGGTKMDKLKTAAKSFVTTVMENSDPDRVSISIVPYNQQVYMDTALMARLPLENTLQTVVDPPAYPGAITAYQTMSPATRCARFADEDFATRSLSDTATIGVSASFSTNNNNSYNNMGEGAYWCGDNWPKMMLYQNDETTLHAHIDSLTTQGFTAIDYGMNWGVGILDPDFRGVVTDMVDDGEAPSTARDHPVDYGTADVLKYVVLMTDGTNTLQQDLDPGMKSGPSRVWWSDTLRAAGTSEFNGYLFEMPDNDPTERWFVPGQPDTNADNVYFPEAALPPDAEQWTKHELYRRFSVKNIAEYFYQTTRDAFVAAHVIEGGYAGADTNLRTICEQARGDAPGTTTAEKNSENDLIKVFSIAFEAPSSSSTLLDQCSSGDGYFFDVDGDQIAEAFNAIAVQISLLRLTE
ncbi:MAG: VWA domain-containing protein [Paracoccaceae bacterium]